jgi:hypothetical protein
MQPQPPKRPAWWKIFFTPGELQKHQIEHFGYGVQTWKWMWENDRRRFLLMLIPALLVAGAVWYGFGLMIKDMDAQTEESNRAIEQLEKLYPDPEKPAEAAP